MNLHPTQLAAIATDAPRVAVLAAPGSGKTAVLTRRAARLLADHHGSEVLLVTFTNAAAAEMRGRIADLTSARKAHGMRASTLHSLAARTLREFADKAGLNPRFSIYDEVDEDDIYLYAGAEMNLLCPPGEKPKGGQVKTAKGLRNKPEVRDRVRQLLREADAVTYDGLEEHLLRILADEGVGDGLRRRWRHVLVDESQDLSETQHAILAALNPPNLFMVGDGGQRIYSFRGATGLFIEQARSGDWRTIEMPVNWRSRGPIVEVATRLGRAMREPGLDQEAGRQGEPAWVEEVLEITAPDRPGYLAAVVADVRDAAQPVYVVDDGLPNAAEPLWSWRDCAILAPTWHQLEEMSAALATAGVPHHLTRRTAGVWTTDEARWAINCLRAAVNPRDHAAMWTALSTLRPRVRIGEWAAVRSAAIAAEIDVLNEALLKLAQGPAGRLLNAIAAAHFAITDGEPAADALGLVTTVLAEECGDLHLVSRVQAVRAFEVAAIAWLTAEAGRTIADLLDAFATRELDAEKADEEEPDEVTLTTIHGAKGLEWPCVWVLGCEASGRAAWPRSTEHEEELRLFYVACTRAKDRLRLCWAGHRGRSEFVALATGRPT